MLILIPREQNKGVFSRDHDILLVSLSVCYLLSLQPIISVVCRVYGLRKSLYTGFVVDDFQGRGIDDH